MSLFNLIFHSFLGDVPSHELWQRSNLQPAKSFIEYIDGVLTSLRGSLGHLFLLFKMSTLQQNENNRCYNYTLFFSQCVELTLEKMLAWAHFQPVCNEKLQHCKLWNTFIYELSRSGPYIGNCMQGVQVVLHRRLFKCCIPKYQHGPSDSPCFRYLPSVCTQERKSWSDETDQMSVPLGPLSSFGEAQGNPVMTSLGSGSGICPSQTGTHSSVTRFACWGCSSATCNSMRAQSSLCGINDWFKAFQVCITSALNI